MGREKRLSEARAKEMIEKKQPAKPASPAGPAAAKPASVPSYSGPDSSPSAGKMILQVLLLYLVPILLIVVFGKLVLGL